ncbi:MAG: hypothetical protein OXR84_13440 [Magnetovibrio sp.]|nr:hypothetical protein [Magnetovibrio sp.]
MRNVIRARPRNWLPAALALAMPLTFALVSTGPARSAAKCPHVAHSPAVTLDVKMGAIKLDNGRSRQQLTRLQDRRKSAGRRAGWRPVGLTLTELEFFMSVRVNAVPTARGSFCGHLQAVEATIGYEKLTVYAARKYRPGSCHYRSIMDHENLHVAVFRNTLEKYAPRVRHRLERAAAELRPVLAHSANQAATRLQKRLQSQIKPLFREMNREMDRANARLDTPENYRREQAKCTDW